MRADFLNRPEVLKTIILVYFIVFSLIYVIIIPPFETPDENLHLQYINYVSKFGRLPNQYEGMRDSSLFVGQGHQHPLYYIFMGSVVNLLSGDRKVDAEPRFNKNHIWGGGTEGAVPVFSHLDNDFKSNSDKNIFYLLRVFSVLFSLINLFFVYKIVLTVLQNPKLACLSVFLAASLPQFQFLSCSVTNDNMTAMFASISVYYLIMVFRNPEKTKNFILSGLFFGLGLLAKKTLIFLILSFVIVIAYSLFQKKGYKNLKRNIIFVFVILFVLTGWYFIRNYLLYGGFLASQMERDTMQSLLDEKSIISVYFIKSYTKGALILFDSFIGRFGWMNLHLPVYIAVFYSLLFAVSFYGAISSMYRNKFVSKNLLLLSFATVFFCLAGIAYFNLTFAQQQGRYLFPVISLIMLIITFGLNSLTCKIKDEKSITIFYSFFTAIIVIFNIISLYKAYIFYHS